MARQLQNPSNKQNQNKSPKKRQTQDSDQVTQNEKFNDPGDNFKESDPLRYQGYGREEYNADYGESEGDGYGRESSYGGNYRELTESVYKDEGKSVRSSKGKQIDSDPNQSQSQNYYSSSENESVHNQSTRATSQKRQRRTEKANVVSSVSARSANRATTPTSDNAMQDELQPYADASPSAQQQYGQKTTKSENKGEVAASRLPYETRGPKGYKPSDERLAEDINEILMKLPEISASGIKVQIENGKVTLKGAVDKIQTRNSVDSLLNSISGISEINNQIRVRKADR